MHNTRNLNLWLIKCYQWKRQRIWLKVFGQQCLCMHSVWLGIRYLLLIKEHFDFWNYLKQWLWARSYVPTLVANLTNALLADAFPCSQFPKSFGEPFHKSGGCCSSILVSMVLEWHVHPSHMGVMFGCQCIFVHVVNSNMNISYHQLWNPVFFSLSTDTGFGTIYVSDDRGTVYSKSLERHLYTTTGGDTDFTNVTSLRGVFITSVLAEGSSIHVSVAR